VFSNRKILLLDELLAAMEVKSWLSTGRHTWARRAMMMRLFPAARPQGVQGMQAMKTLGNRFWITLISATTATALLVLTIVQPQWIELLFGVDPDHANGTLEWALVTALAVATVALWAWSGLQWRRAALADL
jgi:hypothetical protein